ncbi:hypothetical protein M407DRAFT_212451 [Tulasnella calospora MUT 4182]|uniref:Uncharacterized protein n=1 Tax=Tulasnella calospora MUT 4182 TaxID=1051891 RepID=A0A0C3LT26_9AGAM|nr:hypothetical protein M407DRAFT_212451 [Tulasnella calospora MUT 4182]
MTSEPTRRRRFVSTFGDDGGEFYDCFDAMQEKIDGDLMRASNIPLLSVSLSQLASTSNDDRNDTKESQQIPWILGLLWTMFFIIMSMMSAILVAAWILVKRDWIVDNQKDLASLQGGEYDLRWGKYHRRLRIRDHREITEARVRIMAYLQFPLVRNLQPLQEFHICNPGTRANTAAVLVLDPQIDGERRAHGPFRPLDQTWTTPIDWGGHHIGKKHYYLPNFDSTWRGLPGNATSGDKEPEGKVLMAWAIVEMATFGNRNAQVAAFRDITAFQDEELLKLIRGTQRDLLSLAIRTSDFVPLFHVIVITRALSWLSKSFEPWDLENTRSFPNRRAEAKLREFTRSAQKALLQQWSNGDTDGSDPEAIEASISGCFVVHCCSTPVPELDDPSAGREVLLDLATSLLKSPEVSPKAVALALRGFLAMAGNTENEDSTVLKRLTAAQTMLGALTEVYKKDRRTEGGLPGLWHDYGELLDGETTAIDQRREAIYNSFNQYLRMISSSRLSSEDKGTNASWVAQLFEKHHNGCPDEPPLNPKLKQAHSTLWKIMTELGVDEAQDQRGPNILPAAPPNSVNNPASFDPISQTTNSPIPRQPVAPGGPTRNMPTQPDAAITPQTVQPPVASCRFTTGI